MGYISKSITQLAVRLDLHRNTIASRLYVSGYYEDDTCYMFCIDNEQLIKGLPTFKGRIKKENNTGIVQSTPLIAQKPIVQMKNTTSDTWKQIREELGQ
ncbi:MAG: hypothetical protein WCO84_06820 [bacterium]